MIRPAKFLLLALIAALLPLRMAALMAGSCGLGEEHIAAVHTLVQGHDSQSGSGKADTHCPGAPAFLVAAAPAPLPTGSDARDLALVQSSGPTFFPDKLDRPPLARS